MKKQTQRVLVLILAVIMLLSVLVPALSVMVGAVTQKEIDAKKNQVGSIEDEIEKLESELSAIRGDKAEAMEQKLLLDKKVALLVQQIGEMEDVIAQYDTMIEEKSFEIAELERLEAEQYALFCQQVRDMEERGTVSYLEVVFTSSSVSELLDSLMLVEEVMHYNNRIIEDLTVTREHVSAAKQELELARSEQEGARQQLQAKQAELEVEAAAAQELLDQIKSDEKEAQKLLEQKEKDAREMEALIKKMEKELAAQIAAAATGDGSFLWPTESRYVTSTFGGRASPGGIGSTNHKGLDIGRVYYSSEVYASKGGVVTVSQNIKSYGNYVVISHGDGTTTLYAHLSSRKVSVGQVVKQGQVIGITGSSGNSTGPHLHFEIWVNGVKKDPLKYLTGSYTKKSG